MNTLKQAIANTAYVKAMALAGALLASTMVSAQPSDESNLAPFSAASIGMMKNTDTEQAAEQELQALSLLQQSAPAQNVGQAAAAAVKSLAPSMSEKSPSTHRVQLMGATPMTREQVIAKHTSQPIPSSSATTEDPYRAPIYHSFAIYDASSRLFEDFDYDGFYRTFSVTFDVDVFGSYLNERADLFAELYLSRNGGPWVHYYTTDVFTIYGDSTQDDYEVLTTLYTGYQTDHYDVLIDVYEVGYSGIVASISADNTDGLYALPLESRDRDSSGEVIIVDEGGAVSLFALLGLGLLAVLRKREEFI
ncbi:MAG: choice-of-anchor H family protein [Shewanella xiamenensis]